jgi:hypothetical protein
MGLIFVKIGIVTLLTNFKFEGLRKEELEFNTATIALLPKHGQAEMKIMQK